MTGMKRRKHVVMELPLQGMERMARFARFALFLASLPVAAAEPAPTISVLLGAY